MDKTTNSLRWHVLFGSALMLILGACSALTPTVTPTASAVPVVPTIPSSTAAPPYIHYAPSRLPSVHLEFDYPGSWVLSEEKDPYTGYIFIGLAEPRMLSVPTRPPDQPHGTPSDYGRIYIAIEPVQSGQTLETLWQEQKHIDETSGIAKLLNDYPLEVDGHEAYALETRNTIWELYTSVMFNRRILFIAYDQFYTMDFLVAEKDRGGEFEKGYDYFFKSLKIVP